MTYEIIDRDTAVALLRKYNQDSFRLQKAALGNPRMSYG